MTLFGNEEGNPKYAQPQEEIQNPAVSTEGSSSDDLAVSKEDSSSKDSKPQTPLPQKEKKQGGGIRVLLVILLLACVPFLVYFVFLKKDKEVLDQAEEMGEELV